MRHIAALFLMLLSAFPAVADDIHRLVAAVAMLPLPDSHQDDVEALVRTHWSNYFNVSGPQGFRREHLRAGRFDLDGDGRAELLVMIDHPEWESANGKPFVMANWTAKGWRAIGWGWSHEDGVFVSAEKLKGVYTVDTPLYWIRWTGKAYQLEAKPQ
jgi:hypothetical protein